MDPEFNIASKENQIRMIEICEQLRADNKDLEVNCFIEEFKAYVVGRMRKEWPVSEEEFHWLFGTYFFYSGKIFNRDAGFVNGKLVFMRARLIYKGFKNLESDEQVALYDRFEKMVEDVNSKSGPGLNKAFQTSYDRWPNLHLRQIFI